jgi:hypothetical protein
MRLASYEVTIAAPAEVVWAHLTTARGPGAVGRPRGRRRTHPGLPPGTVPDHLRGWAYFLGVLGDTVGRVAP